MVYGDHVKDSKEEEERGCAGVGFDSEGSHCNRRRPCSYVVVCVPHPPLALVLPLEPVLSALDDLLLLGFGPRTAQGAIELSKALQE